MTAGTTPRGDGAAMQPMLSLFTTALRHRQLTLGLPAMVAVLVVVIGLVLPRTYVSSASFAPQGSEASLSQLAGLAAQFGVNVPTGEGSESPEFYADLVTSRSVLEGFLDTTFAAESEGAEAPGPLLDLLRATGRTPAARHEDGLKRLRKRITVGTSTKTGVVTLSVQSRWPAVSQGIASAIVAGITEFDLKTRQSRGAAERRFTEERLRQAETELRQEEDRLQGFLTSNRSYRESPTLQFQHDRLQREVASRQQVLNVIRQTYEQARIEEVRNTPRITVIERPNLPVRPESRKLALRGILAFLATMIVGLGLAVARHGWQNASDGAPGEGEELAALWAATAGDLRRPWRLLPRWTGGR